MTIWTGLDMYSEVRRMLLGNKEERDLIKRYERFMSEEFYEGRDFSLIPKEKDSVLTVKLGDSDRKIYDLGDGIQELIILTFPLFKTNNGLFFIEEPEIHLHPGLQRKFIELILTSKYLKDKNHQYFITTHSNHFLDLTFDYQNISIYRFSSDFGNPELKVVENIDPGDERILLDLGVKNSSVFLTNATVWVEGITDRLYIKKYLELYQEANNLDKVFEDIDYSFVEYGGSNLAHWDFNCENGTEKKINMRCLCGKSIVIADKDQKKEKKHEALRRELGNRYIPLQGLEIENLLSLNSVIRAIKKFPKDKGFVLSTPFRKEPNLLDKRIGTFIESQLKPRNTYSEKGRLANSKKLDFCRYAIEDMTFSDMTSSAKVLAEKVYNFILERKKL